MLDAVLQKVLGSAGKGYRISLLFFFQSRSKTDSIGDSGVLTPLTPRSLPTDMTERVIMTTKLSVDSAVVDEDATSAGGQEVKVRTSSGADEDVDQRPEVLTSCKSMLEPKTGHDYEPDLGK